MRACRLLYSCRVSSSRKSYRLPTHRGCQSQVLTACVSLAPPGVERPAAHLSRGACSDLQALERPRRATTGGSFGLQLRCQPVVPHAGSGSCQSSRKPRSYSNIMTSTAAHSSMALARQQMRCVRDAFFFFSALLSSAVAEACCTKYASLIRSCLSSMPFVHSPGHAQDER